MSDYKIWIDGKAVDGTSEISVINPATEEVFATVARSSPEQLEQAIASAKAAQKKWAKTPMDVRRDALRAISQAIAQAIRKPCSFPKGCYYLPQWVKPLGQATYELVVILYGTKSKHLSTYGNADDNTLTLAQKRIHDSHDVYATRCCSLTEPR